MYIAFLGVRVFLNESRFCPSKIDTMTFKYCMI